MPRGPSRPSATPVSRRLRIGIDTGGTFTDIVAIDEATGEIFTTKTPSTPQDPSVGVLDGIRKILRLVDNAAAAASRPAVAAVSHGTTVATNALLQERFPGLGLVTTQGFRHVLEIARQAVPRGYGTPTSGSSQTESFRCTSCARCLNGSIFAARCCARSA